MRNKIHAVAIATESHMLKGLLSTINELKRQGHSVEILSFEEYSKKSILWRINYGRAHLDKLRSFVFNASNNYSNISLVLFACGEGFEMVNYKYWLPEKLETVNKVVVQHGVFAALSNSSKIRTSSLVATKRLVNATSNLLFGYNLVGYGFGGLKLDKYIVYSEKYKNYLIQSKGWQDSSIIIGGSALRDIPTGEIKDNSGDLRLFGGNFNQATFLLQDFVQAELLSYTDYCIYLKNICEQLASIFDYIVIRLHPKMIKSEYLFLEDISGVKLGGGGDVRDDIVGSDIVISFFSSALMDAFWMGFPVIGIDIEEVGSLEKRVTKMNVNFGEIASFFEILKGDEDFGIISQEMESGKDLKDIVSDLVDS